MSNDEYLATLDLDSIADWTVEELRTHADRAELYTRRVTVASLPVGYPEVVGRAGTLTVLDKTVAAILAAFADRDARVELRYSGREVEISAYAETEVLRNEIKWAVQRVHEKAGAIA